ncbi:hypothetical protein AB0A63_27650 [Lentzea sp. NPDC042327]|uniref:hypothetical protein n=1 Tax=Lentzea sp. NPDC042327 TaxID=3154801 RepID=UPI0033D81193
MRKTIIATLSAVTLMAAAAPGIGVAGTSDYPVTPFRIEYGASVLSGSITWYNRSVSIPGELRARSSEKQGRFRGTSANCVTPLETRTAQPGENRGFNVGLNCDYPGGLTNVYVALWEGDTYRGGVVCTRQGCVED